MEEVHPLSTSLIPMAHGIFQHHMVLEGIKRMTETLTIAIESIILS
jgi:hypothetical protein